MKQDTSHNKSAYSIDEAAMKSGIGRVKLYGEIKAGRLMARKCGTRTLILATDLQNWLNHLPRSTQVGGSNE